MNDFDPVEEFFARERRDIHPQPGDDEHWSAIVEAHRRSKRSRWTGFAAGAAAAAVLVGGVGYVLRPDDGNSALPASHTETTTRSSTPAPSGSPTSSASGQQSTSPTKTSPPRPTTTKVPADFRLVSVSRASNDALFGLGTTNCSGHACTQVVRSLDNGKSWVGVAAFTGGVDTPGKTASGKVGTDTSLTDIRMASPQVGWVFGGGLKMTTDGGASWTDYPHDGNAVIDLETDGKQVVLAASAGDCNGKTCAGNVVVQQTDVGGSALTTVGKLTGGDIRGASITFVAGQAVVSVDNGNGSGTGGTPPSVVTAKGLQAVALPDCTTAAGAATVVAAADLKGLFGICPTGGAAGSLGYAVSSSTDAGASWTPVTAAPGLVLTNAGFASFAAADSTHLLAVSGGDPSVHGSMKISSDGGQTWRDPKSAPPMPERGWAWVGSPGGGAYYAIPVGGAGTLWQSTDQGQTWKSVQVAS